MKDGYPEDYELETIREWKHEDDYNLLMDYVWKIWHWTDRVECRREIAEDGGGDVFVYGLSTGGWSGNEEIIKALRNNQLFWAFCWHQSTSGGHYVFIIKEE